jgi:hypothetical protein
VLALLMVAGTGCSDILGLGDDELLPNLRTWRAERPALYQFTYHRVCFCAGTEPVIISVDGDSVTHVSLVSGEGPPPALPSEYPTIDGLFEQLIEWRERDPHRERMEFHDRLGYPTDVFFDFREHVADEEMGFRITDLRALERLEE